MGCCASLVELGSDAVHGLQDGAPRAQAHGAALVRGAALRHEHHHRRRDRRVKLRAVRVAGRPSTERAKSMTAICMSTMMISH